MDHTQYLDPAMIQIVQTGWYLVMLGLLILEWPIVIFIGWFLAATGIFSLPLVLLLGVLGDVFGDIILYSIGYFTGHASVTQNAMNAKSLERVKSLIHTDLFKALIVIKFTPYLAPIWLTMIGAMHFPFRRYILTSLPLSAIWPILFWLSGYYITFVNAYLPKTPWGIFFDVLIVGLILILLVKTYSSITRKVAEKAISVGKKNTNWQSI